MAKKCVFYLTAYRGCGKTFFVKNGLIKAIEEQEESQQEESHIKRNVKYISLYGCKSIIDIQENIAWSFAEEAREKISKRRKISKKRKDDNDMFNDYGNMLIISRKIGNYILKKFDPDASLYSIASDWLKMTSHILIFDDLERCDCPINEVFGFLNDLVEHENTKVILVANEKEISGIAEPKYLEQQYRLAIEDKIEWPKSEKNGKWNNDNSNPTKVSFSELERRRALLFPAQDANSKYKKIREKLIGVTLRYTPAVFEIMSEIISSARLKDAYKTLLHKHSESFKSTMDFYHHHNLRTFQFFLSKVIYLLEKLESISLQDEYISQIQSRIIKDTFSIAVKLKANYQPPRNNYFGLSAEQDTGLSVIKKYVDSGEFLFEEFKKEVLTLQEELQASILDDDPYHLLYHQYNLHSQVWCEEQLNKMIEQLCENKYPLSFYSRIIIVIQRLLDLGFDPDYLNKAKDCMLKNITSMGEVQPIVVQFWDDGDSEFKERVRDEVAEINSFISTRSTEAGCENVTGILNETDWTEGLLRYVRTQNDRYVDDIPVFSKADSDLWLKRISEASPQGIYEFQYWLSLLYPEDMVRESYERDAPVIKKILSGLKEFEEDDLIKKARIKWLEDQFNRIIEINEPALCESLEEKQIEA